MTQLIKDWTASKIRNGTVTSYGHDQYFLWDVVWPLVVNSSVTQHDSFHCNKFRGSLPFPTKRIEKPQLQVSLA